jgi:hypothetical protein
MNEAETRAEHIDPALYEENLSAQEASTKSVLRRAFSSAP